MRRCLTMILPALFAGVIANAQLVNNGATITIQSGATLKCTGTITNSGTINNSGTVSSDGDLRNESGGTLSGTGTFEATTKFVNNGNIFTNINLRLIGNVNTDTIKSGVGSSFGNVNIAKGATYTAILGDAMTVNAAITFENDDNRLLLGNQSLTMGPAATFVSADANEFVVTNGTGAVKKQNLGSTSFTYEVGFGPGEYNPVSISNTGTIDDIGVRCLQNALDQGTTGSIITSHFAKNSWVVTEGTAGGSNLQLIAGWAASDEPTIFDRNKVGIAQYTSGTAWDLPAGNVLAASGSGPYTRNRSGVGLTSGVFAIADLAQVNVAKLNLKVFLQGAYSGTTMTDALRSLNVIPLTQPYSSAMNAIYTRVGVYDGSTSVNEKVPNSTVFDVTGTDGDIVDWVYVSLQDGVDPTIKLQTRAALIRRDGTIVEYDTLSGTYGPVRMPIDANGNYHVIIGHRNHLSIRTASTLSLTNGVTTDYDFTTSQSKAYQNPAITSNAAMKDLGGGVFGMWGGNANSNTTTRASGGNATLNDFLYLVNTVLGGNNAIILSPVYNSADVNMNGSARASGGNATLNDFLYIVNTVLGGNNALIFTAHL